MSVKRLIERFGPALFTFIATFIMALYVQKLPMNTLETMQDKFSNSALSISTSLLGFFLTIYTIIHSVNTERMQDIRSNGAYSRLMEFLRKALYSHAIIIGVLLLFCLPSLGTMSWRISGYTIYLWLLFVAALSWSVAVSLRFITIFLKLINE